MIVYYHIYTESRKTALMNLLAGHAQRLRRREHSRGSRGWAKLRERESNTALHTPPRERWILSGKLLHKAAWGSWRPAGAGWYADVGGRSSRGRGHMYTYLLVHTVIWQKPTQHCIAIILQYKKNKGLVQSVRQHLLQRLISAWACILRCGERLLHFQWNRAGPWSLPWPIPVSSTAVCPWKTSATNKFNERSEKCCNRGKQWGD